MKEKHTIGIIGIIVTILITITVTILAGWLIYEFYIKDNSVSSEESVQSNQNLYSSSETASESTVENVDENYDAQSITKFKMNGKDVEVMIGCNYFSKDEEEKDLLTQKCIVKINDVECTGIQDIATYNQTVLNYNLPEVSLIKGTDNKEYIVLETLEFLPANGPITNLYIINQEGKNLGKITDNGYSLYTESGGRLELDIASELIFAFELIENSDKAEKIKYTVSNDKLIRTVVETISNVKSAGK